MRANTTILLIYSSLVTLGGAMGYLKGGSIISLIAGGGSGLVLFILSYLSFKKWRKAEYIALAIIFLLDGLFTYRFAQTRHFFPSGLLSLISLLTIVILSSNMKRKDLVNLKK